MNITHRNHTVTTTTKTQNLGFGFLQNTTANNQKKAQANKQKKKKRTKQKMKLSMGASSPSLSLLLTITTLSSWCNLVVPAAGTSKTSNIKHPFDDLDKFKNIKNVIDKVYNDNSDGEEEEEDNNGESPNVNKKANTKLPHREIQMGDDPCMDLPTFVDGYNFLHFAPSGLSACAETILIDGDSMLLHLDSMKTIFRQYHCFYDLARDPDNSIPASIQPELGNTIYGVGGGEVDLEAGLTALEDEVLANGVGTMKMFWQIEYLFHLLFDGHVLLPQVPGAFYSTACYIVPERFIGAAAGAYETLPQVALQVVDDGNGGTVPRLQLTMFFADAAGLDSKTVVSIDGMSPHDWYIALANNPNIRIPYQQLGARVNYLIDNFLPFSFNGIPSIGGDPAGLFPDSFVMMYDDGTSETYYPGFVGQFQAYVLPPVGPMGGYNLIREAAQQDFNLPGEQFDAYARAVGLVNDALGGGNATSTRALAKYETIEKVPTRRIAELMEVSPQQSDENFVFDYDFTNEQGATVGIKVEDDYIVLKFDSFVFSPDEMLNIWTTVVQAGESAGAKKVLIDISNNGGGIVATGYVLLLLMFPFTDLQWFSDQWDINYNESMRLFFEAFLSTALAVLTDIENFTDADIQERIDGYTADELSVFQIASDAMVEICNDAVNLQTGDLSTLQCAQVGSLQGNATAFVNDPNLSTYVSFFIALGDTILEYNPWSVVLELAEASDPNITETLFAAGPFTNIRGGVESNVTDKFDILSTPTMEFLKDFIDEFLATDLTYTFDEYVIVSNGISGSMAAIFPMMSSQLYKNRDRSFVSSKVTLVSYGGTGAAEDLSISAFPASVQGVHLEDPIIGDAALRMLVFLLPLNLTALDVAVEAGASYTASVAPPPFFADTLPLAPVVNFYDKFMEPGALPLQYINYPVDEYIPKTYFRTTFEDSADLAELYVEVAKFFTATQPTEFPTPVPVTSDPTPAPVDMTPAPVDMTPAPVDMTPAPVDMTPAPVDMTPAPVDMTPAPVEVVTPAPVQTTSAPASPEPAPTDAPTSSSPPSYYYATSGNLCSILVAIGMTLTTFVIM